MRAIVAMSSNRVIGAGNRIPWRIPEEHRWFRRATMDGVLVMGRRTFESLPRVLDGRISAVLTHEPRRLLAEERRRGRLIDAVEEGAPGGELVRLSLPAPPGTAIWLGTSLSAIVRAAPAGRPLWLCGGAQLYAQFLPECEELFLTVIDREVEGDAVFPAFEHLFEQDGVVHEGEGFRVLHYRRRPGAGEAPAP